MVVMAYHHVIASFTLWKHNVTDILDPIQMPTVIVATAMVTYTLPSRERSEHDLMHVT